MEITADRAWKKKGYTISRVFVNGKRFGDGKQYCNILEDEDRGLHSGMTLEEIRRIKKYGETAIPRGRYQVIINWSYHFKKYMPLLLNVKGFDGVRIHSGNTPKDTLGCLLAGRNDVVGQVSNSKYWTSLLVNEISIALKRGEKVWIDIK